MIPTNRQVTDTLLARWPKETPRTKQMRAEAAELLTEFFNITDEEKSRKHPCGSGLFSALLGGALAQLYGRRVDSGAEEETEAEIKEDAEVQKVRKSDEFELRDCDGLKTALLKIGLQKDGIEFRVSVYGRIDVPCSELSTGEFTGVELKVVDAGFEEAAQAAKYVAFQERVKGKGTAGRVIVIAPSFNVTFWCVANRFPEIQAYSYVKMEDGTVVLTRELNG